MPVEICLDNVAGAVDAEQAGASRVEVCAGLSEGGTTPSIGLVGTMLERVSRIGVQVLVRPRAGDFSYSDAEIAVMLADIQAIRALPRPPGVEVGFVLGALTPDGDVDLAAMRRLLAGCTGCPVTFHKAFDDARDLPATLETLVALGVDRVLTSGGAPTAAEGADMLADLVRLSRGRIRILLGGSVRAHNVADLLAATAAPEVHLRAGSAAEVTALIDALP